MLQLKSYNRNSSVRSNTDIQEKAVKTEGVCIYGSVHRVHGQSMELKGGALSRGNRRGKESTYFERVHENEKWKECTNERDKQKHASFPHFMW